MSPKPSVRGRCTGRPQLSERVRGVVQNLSVGDGTGKGRGAHFTPKEALKLAKGWIEQSMCETNQNKNSLLKGIYDNCKRK